MSTTLTIQACLDRAHDLTGLADRETHYDLILLYDDLAREWRRLACIMEVSGPTAYDSRGALSH